MFQTADSSLSNALEEVANAGPLLHQNEFLENDKENTVWPKSSNIALPFWNIHICYIYKHAIQQQRTV
jgi:hypothetical protein